MRTKRLRELEQGLVSFKEEYKRILNYKQWRSNILNRGGNITAYGKGELLIWSFKLQSGIGRVDVGCCWLLLIADGCYWLLLVATGRFWLVLVAAGCCRMAAAWILVVDDCWLQLGYCLLNNCWQMSLWIYSGYLLFAAQTFLQAKSLWIFPGDWWFAAKTILHAKRSLNFSSKLMICG